MGDARRKKLAQESGQSPRSEKAHPHDLPLSHYERVRSQNKNMFEYMVPDLERLNKDGLRLEDILPPNSECNENAYVRDYAAFLRTQPNVQSLLRKPGGPEALLQQLIREYRCVLGYEHAGRKTYYVTEGLTEGLCCTRLNVPCSDFKLPVPCIQLVYDSPDAREAMAALTGGGSMGVSPDSVISVYVREDNLSQIGFRRLMIVAFEQRGSETLRGVARQLALRDDWSLEQALLTDWDSPELKLQVSAKPAMGWKAAPDDESFEVEPGYAESFLDQGLMFIRLVVNSVLYIASRNAELAEKVWPRPIEPQIGRPEKSGHSPAGPKRWTLVGEHVEPIPIILDPRAQHENGTLGRQSMRYKVRFLVPGFHRRKPGSAPDAPKDVWVRHHYRGPEMADVISNPYIVR